MKSIVQDQPAARGPIFSHYPSHPPMPRVPLTVLGGRPCPYLPGREAVDRAFLADKLPPRLYHGLMDRGFRRSGGVIYQPICRGCRACTPVRVRTGDFLETKSLRRCRKRNADLCVTLGGLSPDAEKFDLYARYQRQRHGETGDLDWQSFADFLYDSPVNTIEFCYRDAAGRLLAVGICDVCDESLSSVYFYYEPDEPRRGLGTFGVLREIDFCRLRSIPHYYLGFWVDGCAAMAYKTHFRPYEQLGGDGVWRDALPNLRPAQRPAQEPA